MDSLCILIFAIFGMVSASLTWEERKQIRDAELPLLLECALWHGIAKELVFKANPAELDSCFYACYFRKTGAINEDGFFDPQTILTRSESYTNDNDYLRMVNEVNRDCISVNKLPVRNDEIGGCERAKQIVECLMRHSSKIASSFKSGSGTEENRNPILYLRHKSRYEYEPPDASYIIL